MPAMLRYFTWFSQQIYRIMKTLQKKGLPWAAGILFAAYAVWLCMTYFYVGTILELPAYLLCAAALLKRDRGRLLAIAAVLWMLLELWTFRLVLAAPELPSDWRVALSVYLAGAALLLLFILVNTVAPLKKFRIYVNIFWFLPGAVMLLTAGGFFAYEMLSMGFSALESFYGLDNLRLSLPVSLGALIIPLWLACSAEDDLLPYQQLLGSLLTEEQLEEKRRELGLKRL